MIISPFIGLALFLVISCYHFGETQVIGFHNTSNKLLNFVVGANILLSLFLNNIIELQGILKVIPFFQNLTFPILIAFSFYLSLFQF